MYNPYNWKISKKEEKKVDCICILDELGFICNELEMERLGISRMKKQIESSKKNIMEFEKRKLELINMMLEKP